jgi:hypothetical protein
MPLWRAPPDGKSLDRRNRLSLKHQSCMCSSDWWGLQFNVALAFMLSTV